MASYPHQWRPLTEHEAKEHSKFTPKDSNRKFQEFVRSGDLVLPKAFSDNYAEKIYNMEVLDDDIWIVTYPKCGTTWTQEIIWSMVHKMDPEMKDKNLFARTPFLELPGIMPKFKREEFEKDNRPYEEKPLDAQCEFHTLQYVQTMKRPRVIKTHLPFSHLPPNLLEKAKVVYVCRGVKDQMVSYYHHERRHANLEGEAKEKDFEDFARKMMTGLVHFGDYFSHLKEGWAFRSHPNVKFVWYEDMKQDFDSYLAEMENFLDCHLTEAEREQLKVRTKIDTMRQAAADREENVDMKERKKNFYRKGIVGDSKNYLKNNAELEIDLNRWIEVNLRGTDIDHSKW